MRFLRKKMGQSTLEYAILVVVVIMALVASQAYIKRAVQGRMKESSDDIGEAYSMEFASGNITTTTRSVINERADAFTTNRRYDDYWSGTSGDIEFGNFELEYYQ